VGEGLGGGAGEPWRGWGGVGRRKKVGEEGGCMDKVEGVRSGASISDRTVQKFV
jgi:hypothetical protein